MNFEQTDMSCHAVMESMEGKVDRFLRLYPKVDESETPLPRAWSTKDKYTYIGLSQSNLKVHYKGTGMYILICGDLKIHVR